MSSTDIERLETKVAETKASYDKIKQFADLLYNQGLDWASQFSTQYKSLTTDMQKLKDEHHQLSLTLNAIKLNQKVQQIEELTAENQLLRDEHGSGASFTRLGAFKTEHPSPAPSETGRKRRRESTDEVSVKNTNKLVRGEIPVRKPSSGQTTIQDVFASLGSDVHDDEGKGNDSEEDNDQIHTAPKKRSSDTSAASLVKPPTPSSTAAVATSDPSLQQPLDIPSHVDILVHKESRVLMLAPEEPPHLMEAWCRDGKRLQRHWNKQVQAFDEKNSEWHKLNDKVQGCVRSTLFQAGKCYLTTEDAGVYACRTCWNTSSICVGWDDDEKVFYLRPQLPEARRPESNPNPGPFDVEMYESGNPKVLRRDIPKYWE